MLSTDELTTKIHDVVRETLALPHTAAGGGRSGSSRLWLIPAALPVLAKCRTGGAAAHSADNIYGASGGDSKVICGAY